MNKHKSFNEFVVEKMGLAEQTEVVFSEVVKGLEFKVTYNPKVKSSVDKFAMSVEYRNKTLDLGTHPSKSGAIKFHDTQVKGKTFEELEKEFHYMK
jgi:hypothetical protein